MLSIVDPAVGDSLSIVDPVHFIPDYNTSSPLPLNHTNTTLPAFYLEGAHFGEKCGVICLGRGVDPCGSLPNVVPFPIWFPSQYGSLPNVDSLQV